MTFYVMSAKQPETRERRLAVLVRRIGGRKTNAMSENTPIRIERATERDVPLILQLIQGLAVYEKLAHEVTATEEGLREDAVRCAAGGRRHHRLRRRDAGRLRAVLPELLHIPRQAGAVPRGSVRACRSGAATGLGLALMKRLAEIAVERGCGRFEWSVLDWNEPAIGFYKGSAPG